MVLGTSSLEVASVLSIISGVDKHVERLSVQDHRNAAPPTGHRNRLARTMRLLDHLC